MYEPKLKIDNILGKPVKEVIGYLVTEFKNNGGAIEVCETLHDKEPVVGMEFKLGCGCLITTEPIMDAKVCAFAISGIGYYKFIRLAVLQ